MSIRAEFGGDAHSLRQESGGLRRIATVCAAGPRFISLENQHLEGDLMKVLTLFAPRYQGESLIIERGPLR